MVPGEQPQAARVPSIRWLERPCSVENKGGQEKAPLVRSTHSMISPGSTAAASEPPG